MSFADVKGEENLAVAYDYPAKPGTEEWIELGRKTNRLEACQIPEDVLNSMTTEALALTVVDYPYLSDIFVFNNPQEGLEYIRMNFNGLDTLLKRKDGAQTLLKMYKKTKAKHQVDKDDYKAFIERLKIESLLIRKEMKNQIKDERIDTDEVYQSMIMGAAYSVGSGYSKDGAKYSPKTITTPNGSEVSAFSVLIFDAFSYTDLQAYKDNIESRYPSTTFISDATQNYNCHSYAWYSQNSSTNKIWLNDPSMFWQDGSYEMTIRPTVSNRVYYYTDHSAIVKGTLYYPGSTNVDPTKINVISKWGHECLIEHTIDASPYYFPSVGLRYYQ